MSSLSRITFAISKRVQWCATSSLCIKSNLNSSLVNRHKSLWDYKTLAVLSSPTIRSYSSKVNTKSFPQQTVDGNDLIYTGHLNKHIRRLKLFSLTTSVFGIGAQPFVYCKAQIDGTASAATLLVFGFVGVLSICTPLVIHFITKRYILSIEHNKKTDQYIATTFNLLTLKKKLEFTTEDVTTPSALGIFSTCHIKGKPYFIDPSNFTDKHDYAKIMGYDKPLDLQMDTIPNESTSEKKE